MFLRFALLHPIRYNRTKKGGFSMAMEYTEEQLNKFDKATIVQLFLAQQSQLKDIDNKY